MAAYIQLTDFNAWFKRVYGDLVLPTPEHVYLYKNAGFAEGDKIGRKFNFPVYMSHPQGFTHTAATDGVSSLNTSIAPVVTEAEVDGSVIDLELKFGYTEAMRAMNGGKSSYGNVVSMGLEKMSVSMHERLEILMLYGGTGLGKTASGVATSAVLETVTFSAATWAPAIWMYALGANVQFYLGSAVQASSAAFTVGAVNIASRTVVFSGSTAACAALDTAVNASGAALDVYFYGAYGKEMVGIDKVATTAGTLYGVDNTNYAVWQGNSSAVGGAISLEKILLGLYPAMIKGMRGDAQLLVNPQIFSALAADEAALVRHNASKKAENGFNTISYYYGQGSIDIVGHPYVKFGEGFACLKDSYRLIGGTKPTMMVIGKNGEVPQYFERVAGTNGFAAYLHSDLAVLWDEPGKVTKFTGITG